MTELSDIEGVGPSRADDLEEMGYTSVEDVAEAEPEDLEELSRVGEDKALEMVVSAQNLLDSAEDDEPEETITFDEEELDEEVEDLEEEIEAEEAEEEDEEADEEDADPEYDVSLDLSARQSEILVAALLNQYTALRSRNVSRSRASDSVLVKLRDSADLSLTTDELNALYSAVRQRRVDYQGDNHVELMQQTREVEEVINDARQEHLF